jgi:hypothetical protein
VLTETARLLRTLERPPAIHRMSPCDATRELAAAALQPMADAHGVDVHASDNAAGTLAAILESLTQGPPEPRAGARGQARAAPVAQS